MRWGIIFCLVWASTALVAAPAVAVDVSGRVSINDGDSLKLAGESIRLHGIDAPELSQTCRDARGKFWSCGRWARSQLQDIIRKQRVNCTRLDTDKYGRTIATCTAAGQDIAALMVDRGAAVAFTRFSTQYTAHERAAKSARRGIWAGTFDRPETYRAAARVGEVAQPVSATGCVIKGNISDKGRIYHMPGQKFYNNTKISTQKGERWFCTESDARAPPWHKARN